jgi:hypothetical protein
MHCHRFVPLTDLTDAGAALAPRRFGHGGRPARRAQLLRVAARFQHPVRGQLLAEGRRVVVPEAGARRAGELADQHAPADHVAVDAQELERLGELLGDRHQAGQVGRRRIRRMARQRLIVDGPFTESKELVGGYLIVQASSLDEAIDIIRPWVRIHRVGQSVPFSAIEVRRLTGDVSSSA